jgi:soluble lytic murein transglycosylase-like protein
MTPKIAVQITAVDKTDGGFRSAQKRADGFSKRTETLADKSGFARLSKVTRGFGRITSVLDRVDGKFADILKNAQSFGGGFREVANDVLGVTGLTSDGLGGLAGVAATASGAIAATTAAVVGLGVATYLLGSKWANTGAEIGRTAETLGVTTNQLQEARAASERFGVSAQSVDSSIESLGMNLRDARFGSNNTLLALLNELGIKLKYTKDGAIDTHQALLDLADATAAQKDTYAQQKIAQIAGLSGMLPALRKGSKALQAEGADYAASGAELTPDEVARSTDVNKNVIKTKQHLGALEKTAGMAAEDGLDVGFKGLAAAPGAAKAALGGLAQVGAAAKDLAVNGFKAAESGAKGFASAALDFAARIEHQESRSRQFDKHGRPLTSSAGAVGAMQMLPKTARETAAKHGVAWDPQRLANDKAYNEKLGDLHLGDPRKGQISDADFAKAIPFKETRDYVANTAKADITIRFANAPPGTSAKVTADPGVNVHAAFAPSLAGPG